LKTSALAFTLALSNTFLQGIKGQFLLIKQLQLRVYGYYSERKLFFFREPCIGILLAICPQALLQLFDQKINSHY
jgi:hypothetical protein